MDSLQQDDTEDFSHGSTVKGKGKASAQSNSKTGDRSTNDEEFGTLTTPARSMKNFRSMNSFRKKSSSSVNKETVKYAVVERHGSAVDDEDFFEGLENVRACCDGAHDGQSTFISSYFPL